MTENVAEYVARVLRDEGVEYVFILTGGDQALWIALDDMGVRPVLARSEASAVYMADGYARSSGKVGVVYGQAGPGTANVAAALADPYWNRTPILVVTSCVSTATEYRNDYQELQTDGMLAPVTVESYRIPDPSRVADMLPRALQVADAAGPVSVSIPRNRFTSEVANESALAQRSLASFPQQPPWPAPDALDAVGAALDEADRPLVLVGAGAQGDANRERLCALARDAGIPVVSTVGGKGLYPEDDERWVGVVGRYSSKVANVIASEADVVLVLGSRLGGLATDGYKLFNRDAQVIQVDRDRLALGSGYPCDLGVCSEVGGFLRALSDRYTQPIRHDEWAASVAERVAAWRAERDDAPETGSSGTMKPYGIFSVLNHYAEHLNVVADTGYMAAWTATLYEAAGQGRSFFRANGSLGWAFPAALGVGFAGTRRRTVCVVGDGGLGYHIGDFETALRYQSPVITVVLNNQGLAFEYHAQLLKWNGRVVPSVNDFVDVDHAAVARAFGLAGKRVETLAGFEAAFKEALDAEGPYVIDAVIDREEFAPITNFDAVVDRRV